MEKKYRKGQLKKNGKLGQAEGFDFVSADTIIQRLKKDGTDMKLTIGLSFRNPTTNKKPYKNRDAIEFLRKYASSYTYEAYYTGDGYLYVTALSGNDLF